MLRITSLLLPLSAAACMEERGQRSPSASAAVHGGGPACLTIDRIAGRRAIDGEVEFEMAGGLVYRSEPQGDCPSLRAATPGHLIALDTHGAEICSGDRFQVIDPAEARAVGLAAFPQCRLGRFVPARR